MRSLLFFLGLCLVGLGLGMPEVAPTKADGVKAAGPRLIQGLLTIIGGSYAAELVTGTGIALCIATGASWLLAKKQDRNRKRE